MGNLGLKILVDVVEVALQWKLLLELHSLSQSQGLLAGLVGGDDCVLLV